MCKTLLYFAAAGSTDSNQSRVLARKPQGDSSASPPAGQGHRRRRGGSHQAGHQVQKRSAMASSSSSSVVLISDTDNDSNDDDAASDALSGPGADRIASTLRTQAAVDALCRKHGVPREFLAHPAGDLRACSTPPPGAVCVYAHALETGVRFPLHAFFCDTLNHLGLAPGQLSLNGWRVMVGFVALCHEAGVRPSLVLFRHFFKLYNRNGWCYIRCRVAAGVLFTGLNYTISEREWKGGFFFLTSPGQWPCPVRWGEPPSRRSSANLALTSKQRQRAEKLLGARGAAVDIRAYLRVTNLDAALSGNLAGAPPPPPPQPSPRSTLAKGVDPPVRNMTDTMPVEKTAAPAAWTEQVKGEAYGDTLLSGKKRKREEATATDGLGCAAPVSDTRAPSGFDPGSPHSPVPDAHDGDTADWKAARKVLECIVTPSREDKFAASKPSDVVASSYVAMLQAVNYVPFSSGYALDLDEKLVARERDNVALWEQMDKEKMARQAAEAELEAVKAELAAAKRATDSELESAKTAAVQQFLASEEHTRRLAEHALAGYERGAEEMKGVVLRHYPRLDAAKLVLPLD
ncbi:hypothetical protein VPH35_127471 [Triticum aestivum]